jgi:predicted HicB family RNase H-like nuclease
MKEYKGYIPRVEYDSKSGVLHGEVVNTRDVITFEADSVPELRKAFKDSVDDYLEFCEERGEEPEKPFSGNYLLRMGSDLHKKVSARAAEENQSINQWIKDVVIAALL